MSNFRYNDSGEAGNERVNENIADTMLLKPGSWTRDCHYSSRGGEIFVLRMRDNSAINTL